MIRFGNLTILQRIHLGVYFFLFFRFTVQGASHPLGRCVLFIQSIPDRRYIPCIVIPFFFSTLHLLPFKCYPRINLCSIPDYPPPTSQPLVVILTSQILLYTRWCESNMCIYAPWLCALAILENPRGIGLYPVWTRYTRRILDRRGDIHIRMRAVL